MAFRVRRQGGNHLAMKRTPHINCDEPLGIDPTPAYAFSIEGPLSSGGEGPGRGGRRAFPKSLAASFKLTAVALVASALSLPADTHIWTGNAVNDLWSTPSNWEGLAVPSTNEAVPVILKFPDGIAGSVTNDIPGLIVDRLWLEGNGVTVHGAGGVSLTVRGLQDLNINLYSAGANHIAITLPLILNGTNRVVAVDSLSINSVISGNGGIDIEGNLRMDGIFANTYTGPTILQYGTLTLDKYFSLLGGGVGVVSVPGPLVIQSGTVLYSEDNGIADGAPVMIQSGGRLDLNGYDDTIGALGINDGEVATLAGTLTLGGNVDAYGISTISGNISLGGTSRTFDVNDEATLSVWAHISNGAGIGLPGLTKTGLGLLKFHSANYYSGSTIVDYGTLELRNAQALGTPQFGSTSIGMDAALVLADGVIIVNEPLRINFGQLRCDGIGAWTGPINLAGDCTVRALALGDELALTGAISGLGNLTHVGGGRLLIGGTNSNSYTGTTTLLNGSMWLAKSDGALAVPGNLSIGFSLNPATNFVLIQEQEQIANNALVTAYASAHINLNNGINETVGDLVLSGAEIHTGSGMLILDGDCTVNQSSQSSVISGKLSLGGAVRTFNTAASGTWPALDISAVVSGQSGAGITKIGTAELRLSGANTYPGFTTVSEGVLSVYHDASLGKGLFFGGGNGTIVSSGASISLNSCDVLDESLSIAGTGAGNMGAIINHSGYNSWSGPVQVTSPTTLNIQLATGLTINGVLSGASQLDKWGSGKLTYGGTSPNTLSATTYIKEGELELNKNYNVAAIAGPLMIGDGIGGANADILSFANANQILDSVDVVINTAGVLKLKGHIETIGALLGGGNIDLGDGNLTVGANGMSTGFYGPIAGASGRLTKIGAGTLTLTGNLSHTGDTLIKGGTLLVNGIITSSHTIATNEAVLAGNGQVASAKAYNGVISPGASVGTFETGSILLNHAGEVRLELNGPVPGTGYDQINVFGTVTLGNARLTTSFSASTPTNTTFMILSNDGGDPVNGTFQGLQENGYLWINSCLFRISYQGGDGNDVVLTQLTSPVAPTITSIQKLPDGTIKLDGHGIAFALYTFEFSQDLETWQALDPVVSDDGGFIHYIDQTSNNLPHCFYRLKHVADPGQF